jgi:hypothetical protein
VERPRQREYPHGQALGTSVVVHDHALRAEFGHAVTTTIVPRKALQQTFAHAQSIGATQVSHPLSLRGSLPAFASLCNHSTPLIASCVVETRFFFSQ